MQSNKILILVVMVSIFIMLLFVSADEKQGQMVKFQPEGKTWEEILEIVQSEGKPGFLYFTLEGCGPCKALEERVFHDKDAIEYIESNFVTFWAESNNKIGNQLFKKFNIRGTPTVVLINESGELLNKLVGYGGTAKEYIERLKSAVHPDSTLIALKGSVRGGDLENIEASIKYAEKLMYSRETNEAIKEYEKLRAKFSDPEIYSNLSSCYEQINVERAIEILEEGLKQNIFGDEMDVIYCRLGNIKADYHTPIELRDYPGVFEYYKKIPQSVKDFKSYGKSEKQNKIIEFYFMTEQRHLPFVYIKTGNVQKGGDILREKFSSAYEKKDVLTLSGLLYTCFLHEAYLKEALSWGKKANEISEWKDPTALMFYAWVLRKAGNYKDAVKTQEKFVAASEEAGRSNDLYLIELAALYLKTGQKEKADSLFKKLVEAAGNDFWKYHNLASICSQIDVNSQQALKWAEKAIELSKTEYANESEGKRHLELFPGMILGTHAELLFKTGQVQKAIEVSTQAVDVSLTENDKRRFHVNLEKYKAALK